MGTTHLSPAIPLRLPDGMRERIKAEAAHNGRSANAQAVWLLEIALAATEDGVANRAATDAIASLLDT